MIFRKNFFLFILAGAVLCISIQSFAKEVNVPESLTYRPVKPDPETRENRYPKLELLRQFGFYPQPEEQEPEEPDTESCGAHSPRVAPQELATRA